jgi:hypothetical protein
MSRRVPGHALTLTWSGVRGPERSSTGECRCGWTESGSSQRVVRDEYRWHLDAVTSDPARTEIHRRCANSVAHILDTG